MNNKKNIQVVAAVIFDEARQVLVSTRPQGKTYTGYWEFVGGKVELNETNFQALQREASEELGLSIHKATPWLKKNVVYEKIYLKLSFWRVYPKEWSGPIISQENQQWEWVQIEHLTQKKLLPANYSFAYALLVPEILYLNNSLLISTDDKFRIYPYREATHKKQYIYISFKDLEQLGCLPNFEWVAIVIENQQQLKASLSAQSLIWNITSEQSFTELVEVLTAGQFMPILAINFSAEEKVKLQQLGIHGFIYAANAMTA